jgi:hypothetical protein
MNPRSTFRWSEWLVRHGFVDTGAAAGPAIAHLSAAKGHMNPNVNPFTTARAEVSSWLLSILRPPKDWSPEIRKAVASLTQAGKISEAAEALRAAGLGERSIPKLLLFIPSAFAREVYEPQGVGFPDFYLRPWCGKSVVRLPYRREPIYIQARRMARDLLARGQSSEVEGVLRWSAEQDLMEQAKERGLKMRQVAEILHEV